MRSNTARKRFWLGLGVAAVAAVVVTAGALGGSGGPTITTIAGSSDPAHRCCLSGDGGPAIRAKLAGPTALVVDAVGNVYMSDSGNSRVRKVCRDGTITTVAGTGEFGSRTGRGGFSGDGGLATRAKLNYPRGLALDGKGNLYIADFENDRVRKVDSRGIITTFAGGGTATGPSWGYGGPATSARLFSPWGLAVDGRGNVYIAQDNFSGGRVSKVSPDGTITHVVAGAPDVDFPSVGDGGPANSAILDRPWGIAVDKKGSLYIADSNNNRIRKVSSGMITTIAGTGEKGFSGDSGPATRAKIYLPSDVAVDGKGNVYFAEYLNYRVRKVSPRGIITTVAGMGDLGNGRAGDGGPATRAKLDHAQGVAVDRQGNLYIADTGNSRARKVWNVPKSATASPELILGGEPTQSLAGRGIGLEASCNKPCSLVAVGSVVIPGTSYVFKLKAASAPRAAACSRTLTLILSTVDERRFRQLLKPGQEARAVITVRATDKIGNSDTEKRTVAVR